MALQDKVDSIVEDNNAAAVVNEAKFVTPEQVELPLADPVEVPAEEDFLTNVEVAQPSPDGRVQVTGLKDVFMTIGERVRKAEEKLPPISDEPVQTMGTQVVIREASPEEIEEFSRVLGGEYTKGLNLPRIADNLDDYNLEDHLARVKDANKELFEAQRRGTLNMDDLLKLAEEQGTDGIVGEWLERKPGSGITAEDVITGIIAARQVSGETQEVLKNAQRMPDGPERDAEMIKFRKLLTIEGNLYANISGEVSEAGRTLYAVGKLPDVDLKGRAAQIDSILTNPASNDVEYMGTAYSALPTQRARSKFVQQTVLAKSMDVVTEIWINSILSAPTTHMVNIFGNTSFATLRTLETLVAGGIGRGRTAMFGGTERVRAREALIQLQAMKDTVFDALLVAGKTLYTEEPSDIASKIDVRNRRAIGTTGDLSEIGNQFRTGHLMTGFTNALGTYYRMGGRFLLAEDEFFKLMGYRASLRQLAYQRGFDVYDQAIAAGKTAEEALSDQTRTIANIMENPPLDLVETARDAAREMTFQGDLGPVMGRLQSLMSHPLLKLWVPFFKTPTNVVAETFKRTPFALAHPGTFKKIAAGGRDADIVMARITTGSAIMAAFAYMASGAEYPDNEVVIMGSGPSDRKAKQAMDRIGIQPFSINFKQEDGSYKSVTFSRLDPISGLLAMAADMAYYSQYENDPAVLEGLAKAAVVGVSNYALDMPFLQGAQDLTRILRSADDPVQMLDNFVKTFGEKAVTAGLSAVPTVSSFTAGLERMDDPAASSPLLPAEGIFGEDPTQLPSFMQAFYTALQKAKARNPMFSDGVPPQLNLWGEVRQHGTGAGWEFWSPIRIKNTEFSPVDEELMRLGGGLSMPPKKINGVLLNAEQYNRWITLANQLDDGGKLPGESGYKPETTMVPTMMSIIYSPPYRRLPDDDDRLDTLRQIKTTFFRAARERLKTEDIDLNFKILSAE